MATAISPDAESIVAQLVGPMEEAADRLEKRGERLLREAEDISKQGRLLLQQAAELGVGAASLRKSAGEDLVMDDEDYDGPRASVGAHGPVTLEEARDAARELGDFKRPELAEALGVSLVTVGRWLNHLQTHGYITAQGKTRNRHFVWNEQKEAGEAFLAQQRMTARRPVEEEAVEKFGHLASVGAPVEGTGNSKGAGGSGGKMIRDLHSECRAAGCRIERMGSGHWKIILPSGETVTHSSTPGGSSMVGTRSELKKKGLILGRKAAA